MYNPWMMNPMGGGTGMNYWNPQRMQNAQGMGAYNATAGAEGGADRPGYEWRDSRRQGMNQRGNVQDKLGRANDRLGMMQERFKAASSSQQQAMQPRIDNMQNRIDRWQGQLDEGSGAERLGMGWRKERRQAKNAGTYDPQAQGGQPEPAMMQGGFNPWGGMGGMGMGGMGFGGYGGFNPMGMMQNWMQPQQYRTQGAGQNQTGAAPQAGPTPVAPYNQSAQPQAQGGGWNPLTTPTGMGNMFDTSFGRLVPSSVGNQNVFQREGDASTLYNYNPTQGWKSMTPEEYRGYGETNYADPRQFAAANPMMQQWTRGPGGMIQGKVGTGSYA